MHNFIIQVSRTPVPEDERLTCGDLPEYCMGSVYDGVLDCNNFERETAIRQLAKHLGGNCVESETLKISKDLKREYFKDSFVAAVKCAACLLNASFESFCGDNSTDEADFESMLVDLELVMEPYGTLLIYEETLTSGEPWAIDRWLRNTLDYDEEEATFYIGGVLDYHY